MWRRLPRGMPRYVLALLVLVPALALPADAVPAEGQQVNAGDDRDLMGGYDCSYYFGHCFGTIEWEDNVDGSTVEIEVDPIVSMNTSNWFITNEMWLREEGASSNDKCTLGGDDYDPWMEAGMIAQYGELRYFWNDCPPGGSYNENWRIDVPAGDINQNVYVKIDVSDTTSPDDYKASIVSPTLGWLTGYSKNNRMSPNRIQIGQELGASFGGYWSTTGFYKSRYIHGSNYVYQHTSGDNYENDQPPWAYWYVTPAPGNDGGIFVTDCPC